MDDLRWTLRVSSGQGRTAEVYARRHRFTVGAPLSFDEQYPHVSALEHVLGAIGADLVNGLRELARKRRVEIDRVEASVKGDLDNALSYLGVVGEQGHPGLAKVEVKLYVSSFDPPERVEEVYREMLEKSPLARTFRDILDLSFEVVI